MASADNNYICRIKAMILGLSNVVALLKERNYFKDSTQVGHAIRQYCIGEMKHDPIHVATVNKFAVQFSRMRLGVLKDEIGIIVEQYKAVLASEFA